jgi:caa(3)-type oxidase subunit IV
MSHAAEFDEYGHKDHGHVIVSLFTLRFILIALLFCTLLTSGSAWAEQLIASTFHIVIPQWINAVVALSIAVVKTALVVGFFMQLKYDNPMNTVIFVFTLVTVFSFLGFTSLDLGNRATIDRFKNVYAYPGGNTSAGGAIVPGAANGDSIVAHAQATGTLEHGAHEAVEENNTQSITDAGFLREEPKTGSSPSFSRPIGGVTIPTLPGYRAPKPAHTEHPAPHDAPAGEHKPETGHDAAPKTSPEAKPEAAPAAKPEHH